MQEMLNVAVAQSPGALHGPDERLTWLSDTVEGIKDRSVDLLVLPELFLCGYNIGDAVGERAERPDGPAFRKIGRLAREGGVAIAFGYAEEAQGRVYNSAACIAKDGSVVGTHRKLLLPPGFESDHFDRGSDCSLFRLGAFNVAFLICYDAEFPEAFRRVAAADLVLVPTALAAQWGVVAERVIPARAFENGAFVCYANHCGTENGLKYLGSSCIVAPDGTDMARAGDAEALISAQLQRSRVGQARERLPYHADRMKFPWGVTSAL
ncbi:carbon-nitrogen hydrolase family protein [Hoeflea poritis]|uniref:Carbon-nitrogen hydrolase family protein n=1 Tax=Hoeflea poritis TaxID=2993659 RepID=A0ABT4VLZ8_9HYPH|nr:carbon-nitrogen hydrolase family protein [Hoeflea poritis]MDA4845696.1 carbon-nitrogen hydrolase family protein [Hoeflea poritis]